MPNLWYEKNKQKVLEKARLKYREEHPEVQRQRAIGSAARDNMLCEKALTYYKAYIEKHYLQAKENTPQIMRKVIVKGLKESSDLIMYSPEWFAEMTAAGAEYLFDEV